MHNIDSVILSLHRIFATLWNMYLELNNNSTNSIVEVYIKIDKCLYFPNSEMLYVFIYFDLYCI